MLKLFTEIYLCDLFCNTWHHSMTKVVATYDVISSSTSCMLNYFHFHCSFFFCLVHSKNPAFWLVWCQTDALYYWRCIWNKKSYQNQTNRPDLIQTNAVMLGFIDQRACSVLNPEGWGGGLKSTNHMQCAVVFRWWKIMWLQHTNLKTLIKRRDIS